MHVLIPAVGDGALPSEDPLEEVGVGGVAQGLVLVPQQHQLHVILLHLY